MNDAPKRLTPKPEVLRELYLKSGNQCAFPGCNHLIMNECGFFIAQLCHIEAAMPGGPRFNPDQTNEERRGYDNLLLLCHAHHKVTDNEDEYPTGRLKEIKTKHEAIFTNIEDKIISSIVDRTTIRELEAPTSLKRLHDVLNWGLNQDQLSECVAEFNDFAARLYKLPVQTRQLLEIMLNRNHGRDTNGLIVYISEIEVATGCGPEILSGQIEMLDNYGFIPGVDQSEYGNPVTVLRDLSSGWPVWEDLIKFSSETSNITLVWTGKTCGFLKISNWLDLKGFFQYRASSLPGRTAQRYAIKTIKNG